MNLPMTAKTKKIIEEHLSGDSTGTIAKRWKMRKNSIIVLLRYHKTLRRSSGRDVEVEVAAWSSRFARSCQCQRGDAPFDVRVNQERVDVKSASWSEHGGPEGSYYFTIKHKDSNKDPKAHIDSYFLVFLTKPGRPIYRLPIEAVDVSRTLRIPADLKTRFPLQLLGHLDSPIRLAVIE